jgi:hypothetical protein
MTAIPLDKLPQFCNKTINNAIGRILVKGPLGRNQCTIRRITLSYYYAIHQSLILQP